MLKAKTKNFIKYTKATPDSIRLLDWSRGPTSEVPGTAIGPSPNSFLFLVTSSNPDVVQPVVDVDFRPEVLVDLLVSDRGEVSLQVVAEVLGVLPRELFLRPQVATVGHLLPLVWTRCYALC